MSSEKGVARFSKISLANFNKDYKENFPLGQKYGLDDMEITAVYNSIKMPNRATKYSAGYDIFSPIDFVLKGGETIKIPTGIRCKMDNDIVLMIYPRSSYGFKYRMMLENTVGVIDSDYYDSDNEGHIMIKITNHSDKELIVKKGTAFAQGIFTKYYLTVDDVTENIRNGGIGSTSV
ncbi:MAG: deoxyuridine 5'-triphosphate nucleotidohydrolase [Lachnospiraceae bacterium]|nr:deoxyuridine 5'-triphosphate nucleotidohydrolase [Lachnospiraceae bacterium]